MKSLLAELTTALAIAALAAGAAQADTSYSDPVGDMYATSPVVVGLDLTAVEVSNTPDGTITFRATIANAQTLPVLGAIGVALDLDKNLDTGNDGLEALAVYFKDPFGRESLEFERWSATEGELVEVPTTAMSASFSEGVFSWTVPRSDLLDTDGFAFGVLTLVFAPDLANFAADVAPDSDQLWVYDLVGLAPPPPPPTLSASNPTGTPRRPLAGKRFTASVIVTRSDTGETMTSGTVACVVRVGTARVPAAGRFRGGRAQCAMTVPRNAKGRALRGTMTIGAVGASVKKPFSFHVV